MPPLTITMIALQSLLKGTAMASLTIRNLDEALKNRLRLQAAQHGWSMEQEARDILRQAVNPDTGDAGFAQRIHQRFAALELDELPVPKRKPARVSATGEI